jgi:hypothetical protein
MVGDRRDCVHERIRGGRGYGDWADYRDDVGGRCEVRRRPPRRSMYVANGRIAEKAKSSCEVRCRSKADPADQGLRRRKMADGRLDRQRQEQARLGSALWKCMNQLKTTFLHQRSKYSGRRRPLFRKINSKNGKSALIGDCSRL